MNSLILFLKGFFIGIGKVIPGVSGSVLAISLGVYETALQKIQNLWKEKKESFCFLAPLGLGIALAILLGSKLLLGLMSTYYVFTISVFLGLLVGTIPPFIQKEKIEHKDFFLIIGIVLFMYFLENYFSLGEFRPSGNFVSYVLVFGLGVVDAMTTVLPGISGTATFMMLGSYTFVLTLFSNPLANIGYAFCFGLGVLLGVLGMVRLVNYCFQKHRHATWICILGFVFSSIFSLFLKIIDNIYANNCFLCILLFLIGYLFIRILPFSDSF